jgi:hypothetical protein
MKALTGNRDKYVRFEIFTAVTMKHAINKVGEMVYGIVESSFIGLYKRGFIMDY